jgi:hypothetical protein
MRKFASTLLIASSLLLVASADAERGVDWRVPLLPGKLEGVAERVPLAYAHQTAVFNGEIWATGIGGIGNTPRGGAWHTKDGKRWIKEDVPDEVGGRAGHSLIAFAGQLWLIGSSSEGAQVMSSSNGVDWEVKAIDPFIGRRSYSTAFVLNGQMWVVAGRSWSNYTDDAWSSSDGVSWTRESSSTGMGDRAWLTSASSGELAVLVGGRKAGGNHDDIWTTNNGVDWIQTVRPGELGNLEGCDITFDGTRFILAQGQLDGDVRDSGGRLLTSVDGTVWEEFSPPVHYATRNGAETIALDSKVFLIGGERESGSVSLWWASKTSDTWMVEPGGLLVKQSGHNPTFENGISFFTMDGAVHWTEEFKELVSGSTNDIYFSERGIWRLNADGTIQQTYQVNGRGLVDGAFSIPQGRGMFIGGCKMALSSADGNYWQINEKSSDFERYESSIFVHQDHAYIVGGYTINGAGVGTTYTVQRGVFRTDTPGSYADMTEMGTLPFDMSDKNYVFSTGDKLVALEKIDLTSMRVWTSSDGSVWTPEAELAPFSCRDKAAIFRRGDRFWIVGGLVATSHVTGSGTAGAKLTDVWSSPDGITWQAEPTYTELSALASGKFIATEDRAYVFEDLDGHSYTMDRVMSSTDLRNWRVEYWNGAAPRMAEVFPFGGGCVGFGSIGYGRTAAGVYSSRDGINWGRLPDFMPDRFGYAVTAHDGKIWYIGGYTPQTVDSPETLYNDVWSTTDGRNWTRVLESAPFEPRTDSKAISFGGKLLVIGGHGGPTTQDFYGDVWSTDDGIAWTKLTDTAFAGRDPGELIEYADRLLVIGGKFFGASLGDSYATSDGINWDYLGQTFGVEGRSGHATYVSNGKLYSAAGLGTPSGPPPYNAYADIRSTTDGTNWDIDTSDAAFGPRNLASVIDRGTDLILFAGDEVYGTPDVWISGEGAYPYAEPALVDFGKVPMPLRALAQRTVEVYNYEPGAFDPLGLSEPILSGPDADEFLIVTGPTPATLDPGEAAEVTVEFRPTRQGPAEALLTVPTDDATYPEVRIVLLGRGGVSSAAGLGWDMYE